MSLSRMPVMTLPPGMSPSDLDSSDDDGDAIMYESEEEKTPHPEPLETKQPESREDPVHSNEGETKQSRGGKRRKTRKKRKSRKKRLRKSRKTKSTYF